MILAKIYFIKQYIKSLFFTFCFTAALIFVLDFAEVIKNNNGNIILMTCYKSSKNIIHLMSIVILIGTILTFVNLSKRNELMIFTTLGFSKSFFLIIMSLVLSLVFIFIILVFIPINAKLSLSIDKIDDRISFQENGIIFKASEDSFIRAETMDAAKLYKITIWQLDKEFNIDSLITGDSGSITNGQLIVLHPIIYKKLSNIQHDNLTIKVDITQEEIMSNILKPDQVSLFNMLQFINVIKKLGFSTTQYERYFWDKVTLFINYFIMGLVGFIGAYQLVSRLAKKEKIFYGIVIGLGVFFIQDLIITMLPYSIGISLILAKIILLTAVLYLARKYI